MKIEQQKIWNFLILIIRIWLGYRLFTASYSSVTGILTSAEERKFFEKWFGEELHFPLPVVMAFLAKASELAGGIFVLFGFFTKRAAILIAFTMFIATITANLGKDWNIDGGFTISYFLFALILIITGGGKFSMDFLIFKKTGFNLIFEKGRDQDKLHSI